LVRAIAFEPLDRRRLIAKGFQEGKRERFWVKGRFRKPRNSFFNFDCIHTSTINSSGA
jgi:hypothetical protein